MAVQQKRVFFDPTDDRRFPHLPARPTDEEIRLYLNSDRDNPLSKIVYGSANEGNMRTLRRLAFKAFTDPGRSCRGLNFAMYAGPGQGKTYIAKQWAKAIGLPTLLVQSDALESTWMLFDLLTGTFNKYGTPLVPQSNPCHFILPPCLVIFDEAHAIPAELRTGGLLSAMEANDGWLRTKPPGKNKKLYTVDCAQVCWIAMSTDPGLIYKQSSAFYERFRTHIEWAAAQPDQILNIVKLDSQRKFDEGMVDAVLPDEACQIVSSFETVPRRAIAFADQMQIEQRMASSNWKEAAQTVAEDIGIDRFGMPVKIVEILTALARRPMSDKHILNVAKCRREQFDSQYAPVLLADIANRGPLAMPTGKGWAITNAGCHELTKREIQHEGESVLAERYL